MSKFTWGAIKLPFKVDAERLAAEVEQITQQEWGINGRTAPAFANTEAIFLKGYAAAEDNSSTEDRAILSQLPYIKELIFKLLPSEPHNCVLSLLPPNTDVGLHIDQGDYFNKTLRVHFPIITNSKVTMFFGGSYFMKPGEVWVLNNCAPHGVENAHETKPRIHMICDFTPTNDLLMLMDKAEQTNGESSPKLYEKLMDKTRRVVMERQSHK